MQTFLGAIRIFGGTYAPQNFGFAIGGLITIVSNPSLYSLYGTMYGGDGRTSFGLPDLRGRIPVSRNPGSGTGVPLYVQGGIMGTEQVTLAATDIPLHTHSWQASTNPATSSDPSDKVLGAEEHYTTDTSAEDPQPLYDGSVSTVGGGAPHDNMMPFLAINFILALQGVYPNRN